MLLMCSRQCLLSNLEMILRMKEVANLTRLPDKFQRVINFVWKFFIKIILDVTCVANTNEQCADMYAKFSFLYDA